MSVWSINEAFRRPKNFVITNSDELSYFFYYIYNKVCVYVRLLISGTQYKIISFSKYIVNLFTSSATDG